MAGPRKKKSEPAPGFEPAALAVDPAAVDAGAGTAPEAAAFVAEEIAETPEARPAKRAVWAPSRQGWIARRSVLAVVLGVVLLSPLAVDNPSNQRAISLALIYVVVGLSINVLMGYLGQISLGHQAFVGVGAFASALMVTKMHQPFFIGFVMSGVLGAVSAVILGFVALRLKGLYLALITLAYGSVAEFVIFNVPAITGGGAGVDAPRPPGFESEKAYVYLCMAVVGVLLYVDWRLVKSKVGRAIFAIRENEIAASSFGINVTVYKLIAFVISGVFAGFAGALFAHRTRSVVSNDFDFTLALTFVLMTVVGGLGSRTGVFIGSSFFALLGLLLQSLYGSRIGRVLHLNTIPFVNQLVDHIAFVGAVLLILTLTLYPGGIAQQLRPITGWLSGKRLRGHHETVALQEGGGGVRP